MAGSDSQLIVLLPERRRFSGQGLSPAIAKLLGRADRIVDGEAGERGQLLRYFTLQPRGWPMAAISRQADAGDAAGSQWLRADPVTLQPDMTGVRLVAWGNLALDADEAEGFLHALRPLFGDAGFPISAPVPDRWYLKLARGSRLPEFATPLDGMGEDLLAHLPEGDEGIRWRALLNEAQITLHNHPLNIARLGAGKRPVNSIWFWGGGILPDQVSCAVPSLLSDDDELLALGALTGAARGRCETGGMLLDLRRERDWSAFERGPLEESLATLKRRHASVLLDFADGACWRIAARQTWRIWRRPLTGLGA